MRGTSTRAGGWLLLLCLLLLVWEPATFAARALGDLGALAFRGTPLLLVLLADLAVTACGAAAGFSLLALRPAGVSLARLALIVGSLVDIVRMTAPFVPNNQMPGDTPFLLTASLLYRAAWLLYLSRSQRVSVLQQDQGLRTD
jgi:hypothetical protein